MFIERTSVGLDVHARSVAAASKLQRPAGDRVKTDARDALPLPDADPYGLDTDQGDDPDRCRWAARWNYELRRNTNKTDVGRTFCHRAVA